VDDELGTGDVLDGAIGPKRGRRWRGGNCLGDTCDPTGCLAEACCESLAEGACLVSLTTLTGVGGGLFAAITGTGRLGRRLRHEPRAPRELFAAALFRGVRYYQLQLSARRPGYGGCRYTPTCSSYAAEALRRHGALQGMRLAARRLWRCRPGAVGGLDPVP